jgi:pantoate--beta-alanine ligase
VEIIASPTEMQRWSEDARRRGETLAFVPTMGFLHEGHLTLMREGRDLANRLVSSLFVNPTQFGPHEDFSRYPRNFEGDCELMRTVPVDVLFAPEPEAMFPAGSQTWVEATEVTKGLCGDHRPGHFRGVTTVVAKLFNIVKPHLALFGEKDFQQLRAIQRMVVDLNFDLQIIPVATVREADGLAMSWCGAGGARAHAGTGNRIRRSGGRGNPRANGSNRTGGGGRNRGARRQDPADR